MPNEEQKIESNTVVTRQKAKTEEKKMSNDQNSDISALVKLLAAKINETSVSTSGVEATIPEFDGEMAVEPWITNFDNNAAAYGWTEQQKFMFAMNKMVKTAKILLQAVTITNYRDLKKELLKEFGRTYSSEEIHKQLREKKKKESETFNEYILKMRQLGKLGNVDEVSIIKYIVDGVSGKPESKIGLYGASTYTELKRQFEIFEYVMQSSKSHSSDRKYVTEYKKRKEYCFNCGAADHKRPECKATMPKCFKCGKNGHISKNCDEGRKEFKNVQCVGYEKRVKKIRINGEEVECLIDTGADVSVMNFSTYKRVNGGNLSETHSVLRGLGTIKTKPIGEFAGQVVVDDIMKQQKFVVVPDVTLQFQALLGYDFMSEVHFEFGDNGFKFLVLQPSKEENERKELSIYNITDTSINIVVPRQYREKIMEMIQSYTPEPRVKCPVELNIIPDGQIINFRSAPSRLPEEEANAVNIQVHKWLEHGIVRKSTSFLASRVVAVKKKDETYRVCVDYRKLNSMVLKDCFPVPVMEDIFAKLQTARYFSIMDLENGFFHVPVAEESRKYTAFVTKEGLFEFCVAPFGFCNSPAVFIRYVNYIFQDLINRNVMELYMDDIIIFAETAAEGIDKLDVVLKTAAKYNLNIKWAKCAFLQKRINFLGHSVEGGQIWPGCEKTRAVNKFPIPSNIRAVQSFLGLTGFFRKFIPGYANIARPLTNLLKKGVKFEIGENELSAVRQLKAALTKEPVLKIYSRDAPTELHTDASKEGFGGVLMQVMEGQLHPVFYWSKKTSEQDAKKHSYVLEVKAAFLAVQKFRNYLLGKRFKLVTDCSAFKSTTTKKDMPREVAQWILHLQDFDFVVEHRAGEKMKHVDCLSRYPQSVLLVTSEVTARIKRAQEHDDYVKAVLEILKTGPYKDFKVKGGLLYRSVDGHDVLVIPKLLETEIIKDAHNVGHFAVQKTTHNIQQKFWIPHVEGKVAKVVANCVKCIMHNAKLGRPEGYLQVIEKGDVPLHTIHMDHLGPMDASSKQYKYILALVDGFSKYIWLFPTKSTGAEEVVRKLSDWTTIFGNPARIISDRGAAFTANIISDFMKMHNIEQVLTTTGVARGNGQIERVNRSILAIIAKLSADDTTKWYKYVGQVQMAVNSHIHSTTRKSPFQLMFGVQMRNTITDDIIALLEREAADQFDAERLEAREDARVQIQQAQIAYKRNYDKKRKAEASYNVGDLVAIKRTQFVAGKKLASKYLGPYTISKVKRGGRYEVRKASVGEGPNLTSTSSDNMKLWRYLESNEEDLSSGSDDSDQDDRV